MSVHRYRSGSCTLFILLSISRFYTAQGGELECLPWETAIRNGSYCECRGDLLQEMRCHRGILYLDVNRCLTYENSTLFEASCPYIKYQHIEDSALKIPTNLSELNGYFCAPLNREGFICERCKKGYGVSVLTVGYKCADCSNPKHGWLLYLLLKFLPITILYLTIFTLQISISSTSMNCFVFYSQMTAITFTYDQLIVNNIYMASPPTLRIVFKFILTLYEPWNLDFFTHILPDFCISESIKNIHVSALDYVPAFYYLFLIILTYVFLKVNNYRCQISFFQRFTRPFKLCMSWVRLTWNPKASVIDVIATLFILSCTKLLLSSLLIMRPSSIKNISAHPPMILYRILHVDPTIVFLGTYHVAFVVLAAVVLAFLSAIGILLICYPFRIFQKVFSCFGTNIVTQHIHTFADQFQGCFKNGTSGSFDMRLFSVLYFILRVLLVLFSSQLNIFGAPLTYLMRGILLLLSSIAMLLAQPYKKKCYNFYDALLLALLGLQAVFMYIGIYDIYLHKTVVLTFIAISLALPHIVLITHTIIKIIKTITANRQQRNGELMETDFVPDRLVHAEQYLQSQSNKSALLTENSRLLGKSMMERQLITAAT